MVQQKLLIATIALTLIAASTLFFINPSTPSLN